MWLRRRRALTFSWQRLAVLCCYSLWPLIRELYASRYLFFLVARDQQFCGCFFVQPKTSLKELKTLTCLLGAKLVLTVATEAAACFKLHSHLPEEGSLETVVRPVYSSMICGRVLWLQPQSPSSGYSLCVHSHWAPLCETPDWSCAWGKHTCGASTDVASSRNFANGPFKTTPPESAALSGNCVIFSSGPNRARCEFMAMLSSRC